MSKFNRHKKYKVLSNLFFLEVFIKIEVKDNNVEQALRVLKRNFKEMVSLRL